MEIRFCKLYWIFFLALATLIQGHDDSSYHDPLDRAFYHGRAKRWRFHPMHRSFHAPGRGYSGPVFAGNGSPRLAGNRSPRFAGNRSPRFSGSRGPVFAGDNLTPDMLEDPNTPILVPYSVTPRQVLTLLKH